MKKKNNNNNNFKNSIIWFLVFAVSIISYHFLNNNFFNSSSISLPLSDFLTKVESHQIANVLIQGNYVEGVLTDGTQFSTYAARYPDLINILRLNNVAFDIVPISTKVNSILSIFISWFPMLLLIGVWVFFMKQMQKNGGRTLGFFNKSKAKLASDKGPKVTFKDVAGINEAKGELEEIVEFLRDPAKFQRLGGKIPKGCLLIGLPGTGKTLLAKAIAGEANVPFFSISGSDFVEMFVGVGASRVRSMFEECKKHTPCILFIDEIDAVAKHRGNGFGGGNDEREQTLNQILVEMDGFEPNEGIVVIAATNRADVLDRALLRPGRFDRQIQVPHPDIQGRDEILQIYLRKVKCEANIDSKIIAKNTPGFSGADLSNLVNEAALLAAKRNKRFVTMQELEDSKDKELMGVARKSMAMSEDQKKITAYHEGGHATVSIYVKGSRAIHKATIVPRGNSLGMVVRPWDSDLDVLLRNKLKLIADVAVAMGGRVAEEIILGPDNITSGASSDIKAATQIAKAMVTEWGMSDVVGHVFHGANDNYYNSNNSNNSNRSEFTAQQIDQEVKRIVQEGYSTAKEILTKHIKELHIIAKALIEHETLSGHEIKNLVSGKAMDSKEDIDIPHFVPTASAENNKPAKRTKRKKILEQDLVTGAT